MPIKRYLKKTYLKTQRHIHQKNVFKQKLNIFMFFQREIVWDEELKEIVAIEDYFV